MNSYLTIEQTASQVPQYAADEDVIDRYLSDQSHKDFEILYTRYSKKVFGKCLSILKDEEKAQDATQEIFVKIILNLDKFRRRSRFSTWIYSITYNYCIDYVRRSKKDKSILVEDMANEYDRASEDVEDHLLLEINVKRLKDILNQVTVADKMILMMKYQDDLSIREISKIIDKSESAIKMQIKRAKLRFQKTYRRKYQHLSMELS